LTSVQELRQKFRVPGINDPETLVHIARSRRYSQHCKMVENALAGKCPFCQIDQEHNQVILETQFWTAVHCNPPEDHTRFHVLFIPKRHITNSEALNEDEWIELRSIREQVRQRLDYQSRGLFIRDGDARRSAGTIAHLHIHEIVPDGTGRVELTLYKGDEDEIRGLQRAIVYEKLRQAGIRPDESSVLARNVLSPEEHELVADRLG